MKNLKLKITRLIIALITITAVSSCDEVGDTNVGGTSVQNMSGEWYISAKDSNGNTVFGYAAHSTYNTSANDNTMWIDDAKHGYWIKCKVTVDQTNGTFSVTNSENLLDGSKVTITNGKIEKNAAKTKGGHTVDKISFRAHFDYDPTGYDIIYEGHRRTGFYEDEY